MKLFIAILCLAVSSSVCVYAQHTTSIPAKVTTAFAKEYVNIPNVQWDKEGQQYEASFKKDGHDMSVVYSDDGIKKMEEVAIAIDELPAAAQKYAAAKGVIKDAAKITKADKSIQYEAEVNGKDLLFDEQGKPHKK